MASRTKPVEAVRELRAADVATALRESPGLLGWRDERGRNLLHVCCGVNVHDRGRMPRDAIRTAGVLLAAGLDLDREAFREGSWRATPLWYAIARGRNLPLAKHLLGRGADPNHCLWAAGFNDDVAAIRLLLAHGADVDPVTEDETPFLAAVKTSHFASARVLLEHGADPDFRDSRGMTALHYMLRKSSAPEHFAMVVRHGARGDVENADGATAAALLARKRDPRLRRLADQLATGAAR